MFEETYLTFSIRVRRQDERAPEEENPRYLVEAELPNNRFFDGGELRLDFDRLQALESDPKAYGLELFYTLFAGKIREAYDRALGLAEGETGGRVRFRLWLDPKAVRLAALAWERLYCASPAGERPLTVEADYPFSRQVRLEEGDPPPLVARPIRVLFAVANPLDAAKYRLAPLDVAQEIATLYDALGPLHRVGQIALAFMPGRTGLPQAQRAELEEAGCAIYDGPTTLDALQARLTDGEGIHVLHLLSHGRASLKGKVTSLFLEDAAGKVDRVDDRHLVDLLEGLPETHLPRLVFLAACESAKRIPDRHNPYVGLAHKLVEAGIPAVVAMQDRIGIAAARELTRIFYARLLDHGIVDKAMNQARHHLFTLFRQSYDWAVPVLTMRLASGRLFVPDPVRAALSAIVDSELFNPLPSDDDYLPLEALHLFKGLEAVDLEKLPVKHLPCRDIVDALQDIFAPRSDDEELEADIPRPRFVALVGGSGMGKSIHLKHVGKLTALHALRGEGQPVVLPVYLELRASPFITGQGASVIERLVGAALRPFWPSDAPPVSEILASGRMVKLRLLIDGSEQLPDHLRRRAWAAVRAYALAHPDDQYIITTTPALFDATQLPLTDALIMRPLSPRSLRRFLARSGEEGERFYAALKEAELLELAGIPWLLFKMLAQQQRGELPTSHGQVLRALVEETIADIAADQGMRAHATHALRALAWRMQSTFRSEIPIDEAFEVFAQVRGKRGYSLEKFFQELVRYGLLASMGDETLRFGRPHLRTYCAARALLTHPERARLLDDITATLGRRTRYTWWHDTLMFLSGMLEEPRELIRRLLYGVALSEGEQVFLAVDCIREARANADEDPVDAALLSYVLSALLWRLDHHHEPDVQRRVHVAEALGILRCPDAIPHLVKVICERVRETPTGKTYEHSRVRLAAVMALRRIAVPPFEDVGYFSTPLMRLLDRWARRDVEALAAFLEQGDDAHGLQTIAAFALGEIQTKRAMEILVRFFLSPGHSEETYFSLATALALLDPGVVTRCVILPLLQPSATHTCELEIPALTENLAERDQWHARLAYLIGQSRAQSEVARQFLYWCLYEYPDFELKLLAIQSLGLLYDLESKFWMEEIALGNLEGLGLPPDLPPDKRERLQLAALEALYYIGDEETLTRLQHRPPGWSLTLDNALYRTCEEILSRRQRL